MVFARAGGWLVDAMSCRTGLLLSACLSSACPHLHSPLPHLHLHPCSACRVVWYCGTACSHADWRAGHRRVCRALGAARAAEKEQRRQAAAAAEAVEEAAGEGQAE